ncbi:hypothetical protein [uncultured Victivallis sp.]|uniref:hypothetical protein n=1 Tax=uncultured Victivallis sp. TaxID=354118 RepID=UPI0025D77901|nr:hypothetical protein [uncultured Victivallis sp.]
MIRFLSGAIVFVLPLLLAAVDGVWRVDGANFLTPGEPEIEVEFPGSAQLYQEPDRLKFRPQRSAFEARNLELEARVTADTPEPVKGVLFFKDKEGLWFQSLEEFTFLPGEWKKISVRLDRSGRDWHGVGHEAVFDAEAATRLFSAGISIYGGENRKFIFECRNLTFSGQREPQPLSILDWKLPNSGEVNRRVASRFRLAREFFNPYDPKEVTVDYELQTPDGQIKRYPGFWSREYLRTRHFTREITRPTGSGFWEIRFTPLVPGVHRIRLVVKDVQKNEEITSRWREFTAIPSQLPGPVRVSTRNPGYFEFSTGEFYFPIGLNIHTNTDRRSEIGFHFGHLPDRGTYDYDDYLEACGKSGINAVEVWMAGWTFALEHDAGRSGYYGVGRYNTEAAWRLDHVIDTANRNGVLVNLIIDNHGRLSDTSDPEWRENPINSGAEYAVANGGFLKIPGDFFRSEPALENNSKRARYIAARWGATPGIMAVELWSEVDLTSQMRERYQDGTIQKWHQQAATELRNFSQINWLVSTHVSSEFHNLLGLVQLFQQPAITHLAGDAYRNPAQHFAEHLRDYCNSMKHGKPQLITEYGGNPSGSSPEQMTGDIHCGLWGSLFARLAGTPFLWWHDFVHLNNRYDHYHAFSQFLKGIDLRSDRIDYLPSAPVTVPAPPKDQRYMAMALAKPGAAYGWVFNHTATQRYPDDANTVPEVKDVSIRIDTKLLEAGNYRLRWFSTLPYAEIASSVMKVEAGNNAVTLTAPPFRIDLAFKLEQEKP